MDEMGWMRKKAAMGDCRTLVLKNWKEGGVRDGGNRCWAEVEREAVARSGGIGGSGVALGVLFSF